MKGELRVGERESGLGESRREEGEKRVRKTVCTSAPFPTAPAFSNVLIIKALMELKNRQQC